MQYSRPTTALAGCINSGSRRRRRKISGSGRKIEKLDMAAYSQLFTEDYMVRFLLENSLGAWWAARHPESPLVNELQVSSIPGGWSAGSRFIPGMARKVRRTSL